MPEGDRREMLRSVLPAECPFRVDDVLDPGYLPLAEGS